MERLITDPQKISPTWLTSVLRRNGLLEQGRVRTVKKTPSQSFFSSTISFLELSYSKDTQNLGPSHLFLKISKPQFRPELGQKEVEFYQVISETMNTLPIVYCYDAVYSSETGQSHLLLDDLSATHFEVEWPLPPSQIYCEQAMDTLAQLHAFWWEHPQLGKKIGILPEEKQLVSYFQQVENSFAEFVDFLGDRISLERSKLYESIFSYFPGVLWKRLRTRRAYTFIHGDAHLFNMLFPYDNQKKITYMIDWQFWDIGIGTDDLAYMMALLVPRTKGSYGRASFTKIS